jgi:hypothetical protein
MSCTANQLVNQMKKFVGCRIGDKTHRDIIDTYNRYVGKNVMTYSDAWCAATVSAAAILCDATDIIPVDCYCPTMLNAFKSKGDWRGRIIPQVGDIVFFDWNWNGIPDHVGVIEKVNGSYVTTIEGNYSTTDSCQRREFRYDWAYVMGYCRPKYKTESEYKSESARGNLYVGMCGKRCLKANKQINRFKEDMKAGYYVWMIENDKFTKDTEFAAKCIQKMWGINVDGIIGTDTQNALDFKYSTIRLPIRGIFQKGDKGDDVAVIQTALNSIVRKYGKKQKAARTKINGEFNADTEYSVRCFQKFAGLTVDGIVGANTLNALKRKLGCK